MFILIATQAFSERVPIKTAMALDAVDKLSDDDGQPVAKPKPPPKGKSKAKVSPKKKN